MHYAYIGRARRVSKEGPCPVSCQWYRSLKKGPALSPASGIWQITMRRNVEIDCYCRRGANTWCGWERDWNSSNKGALSLFDQTLACLQLLQIDALIEKMSFT